MIYCGELGSRWNGQRNNLGINIGSDLNSSSQSFYPKFSPVVRIGDGPVNIGMANGLG